MALLAELKERTHRLEKHAFALYLAARDPRTPWYARLHVAGILAYAFGLIDGIPDFAPVFGCLDDLLLIPAAMALAVKLIPDPVPAECRGRAKEIFQKKNHASRVAGAVVVAIWLVTAALCIEWACEAFITR